MNNQDNTALKNPNVTEPQVSPVEKKEVPAAKQVVAEKTDAPVAKQVVAEPAVDQTDLILALQKQVSDLTNLVRQSTDPRKLAEISNKNKKVLPICKISLWGGDVVVGWENMSRNKVEIINGRELVEQQTTLLVRTPATSVTGEKTYNIVKHSVDYVASFQNRVKEDVEIIKRTTDEDTGDVVLVVRRADGEELSVSEKFVN